MNYIVFDLEATCWEGKDTCRNETIEIGAVLINEAREVVSEFEQFVKPTKHPELSDFCTQLTSITQAQIDHAPLFEQAAQRFRDWFGYGKDDYILCSWGFYDRVQLKNDSELRGLDYAWSERHISLKHQYKDIVGIRKPIGMKNALKREGMTLDGTHHRGIDDARNISKIFIKYFSEWNFAEMH